MQAMQPSSSARTRCTDAPETLTQANGQCTRCSPVRRIARGAPTLLDSKNGKMGTALDAAQFVGSHVVHRRSLTHAGLCWRAGSRRNRVRSLRWESEVRVEFEF